ncbi:hypothetical protein [Palleronia caenipelagi]|uniref:Uncharacterized protein n=1 Tax=Palleronia caenipelagi TaxID=2489174 RepID=A0A547PNP4_9RHOB|nr:hypothetical protein [Palleronia caenipelagi]TRD15773.1 hypothetical protein FEV53_15035 [Palleronia caenipelagi]
MGQHTVRFAISIDHHELATVLAGLRLLQLVLDLPDDVEAIMTSGRDVPAMADAEIRNLSLRLSFGQDVPFETDSDQDGKCCDTCGNPVAVDHWETVDGGSVNAHWRWNSDECGACAASLFANSHD